MFLDKLHGQFRYMLCRFRTAWRETWPVVEIYEAEFAVRCDYGVTSVYAYVHRFGGTDTCGFQCLLVKFRSFGLLVLCDRPIAGRVVFAGVEPEEKRRAEYAVELDDVAVEVTVDYRRKNS